MTSDETAKSTSPISADAPITAPSEDYFRRWPFAQRIAKTIAGRTDPSSIVIGIYGPWGDGKTSILNLIRHELNKHSNIIVLRFNPWRYGDESKLLEGFFYTLADTLGSSLKSTKEKIGDLLKKYGGFIPDISIGGDQGVSVSPGESARELGAALSDTALDDLKNRIETILREAEKRVVIIMDDIDRLDRDEIYTIFRLVKLTADFSNTAYLLAFDEEVVSASLAERYGDGKLEAGRAFLEKIVQIPLHLPLADRTSLQQICFGGVDQALQSADVQLTEDEARTFVRHFNIGLSGRLTTPRMAKRYANALSFALPILKDEVNMVDLALIEGVRLFLPPVYELVKSNSDLFLGTAFDTYLRGSSDKEKEKYRSKFESALVNYNSDVKSAAKKLLFALFPRFRQLYKNEHFSREWDEWKEKKRICSSQYFARYFSYGIPAGDLSDLQLEKTLRDYSGLSPSQFRDRLIALTDPRGLDTLITKIWPKISTYSDEQLSSLAQALALMGDSIPQQEGIFSEIMSPQARASTLIGELIRSIKSSATRLSTAEFAVSNGEPIRFVCDIAHWIKRGDENKKSLFTKTQELRLSKLIAGRIKITAKGSPIYLTHPKEASYLLSVWAFWGSRKETERYLFSTVKNSPENVTKLLKSFSSRGWGMNSGLPTEYEFDRRSYDALSAVISPERIFPLLLKKFGQSLKAPENQSDKRRDLDETLAHQFAFIRKKIQEEEAQKTTIAETK